VAAVLENGDPANGWSTRYDRAESCRTTRCSRDRVESGNRSAHNRPVTDDWSALFARAKAARDNAHAPYSRYFVGAAVEADDGSMHAGCNVENVSYGLTICAERNAIAAMVAAGAKRISRLLVLTEDGGPPCGACLQVIAEFATASGTLIALGRPDGALTTHALSDLLPHPFEKG
jgi:cytidine deaminase